MPPRKRKTPDQKAESAEVKGNGASPRRGRRRKKFGPNPEDVVQKLDTEEFLRWRAMDAENRNLAQGMVMQQQEIKIADLAFAEQARMHSQQQEARKGRFRQLAGQQADHQKRFRQYCQQLAEKYDIAGGADGIAIDDESGTIREVDLKKPASATDQARA